MKTLTLGWLWLLLCAASFAQNPSNSNVVVVGNPAQPVQPIHGKSIQDAINAAGPTGTVIIPADWSLTETYNNTTNALIIDLRGGTLTVNGVPFGNSSLSDPLSVKNLNVSANTNLNGFNSTGPGNWNSGFPAFGAPADPFCAYMVQSSPTPFWELCGVVNPENGSTDLAFNDGVGTPNINKFVVVTDTRASLQSQGAVPCWNPATAAFSFNVPCRLANPPLYVTPGTPTSQGNECAAITTDSSGGGAVTAAAALRSIDGASKAHDVLCVVTADPGHPQQIGTIIFPWNTSFSTNSAASQVMPGQIESLISTGGVVILTNNGGTTKRNSINFRTCSGLGTGCGTDWQLVEDPTNAGKQEMLMTWVGDGNPFYTGNVLNSTHPGIYFGGSDASTAAVFGIDRFLGKLSHLVRLAADADAWGTLTLSSGTASYSFDRAFASAPLCFATWQSGTLTGELKCATTTTGITITSVGAPSIIASGTASMPTGSLTTNTCATAVTVSATGVNTTDRISWSSNAAPGSTNGLLNIRPYVTLNNVNFLQCNGTSATQGPSPETINWSVISPSSVTTADNAVVGYLILGNNN